MEMEISHTQQNESFVMWMENPKMISYDVYKSYIANGM